MTCDLRLGRWQDALADVDACDAVILDAPYSAATHEGHDSGTRSDGSHVGPRKNTRSINYAPWGPSDVLELVEHWSPRCRGWMVSITDHRLAESWASAMSWAGRYVFPPIPLVEIGSRCRLRGDGPSSWTCWIVVGRPRTREMMKWGTLRGAYVASGAGDRVVMGGKSLDVMREIVGDYSRPGDLVIDPCAGGATTLLAARLEGRRAIGAELDPDHWRIGCDRLRELPRGTGGQLGIFDGGEVAG